MRKRMKRRRRVMRSKVGSNTRGLMAKSKTYLRVHLTVRFRKSMNCTKSKKK